MLLGASVSATAILENGTTLIGGITAVAPVIDARSKHVASSIAFAAVLGVIVGALPLLAPLLSL